MSVALTGVQRTPSRALGLVLIGVLAALVAVGSLLGSSSPTAASTSGHRAKVVVVVGATGGETARYRKIAHSLANQARQYGARVIEVYSPYATWSRVRKAAYNANMLIYLGHGNGWPSRYAPFQTRTKNGLGLNSTSGSSDYNTEYFGERYVDAGLHLA